MKTHDFLNSSITPKNVFEVLKQKDIRNEFGDEILFQGPTTGIKEEKIVSIEKDHKQISLAKKGEKVAINSKNILRKNDQIYIMKDAVSK